MAGVLISSSNVTCGHVLPPKLGKVQVSSSAKLRVNGQPVLLKSSIENKTVAGCATVPDPNTGAKPCTTVTAVSTGEATKLKVGGKAVILDTLTGDTDGNVAGTTPQKLLKGTALQSKLTAI